jgi:peptidyl-prolyl cis-trans isomerase B (cyclophilin B)
VASQRRSRFRLLGYNLAMKLFKFVTLTMTLLSVIAVLAPSSYADVQMAPSHKLGAMSSPIVIMKTVKGTIVIRLYPQDAPITVANFIKLVKKGFYNGLTFHRIADLGAPGFPGKIVQGGDPLGTGNGGPGYTIKGEFTSNGVNNPLVHNAGAVAMARADDPDSAGSQFYICVNPVHFLDGKYAVFGQVIKGLDVADQLVQGDKMTQVYLSKSK